MHRGGDHHSLTGGWAKASQTGFLQVLPEDPLNLGNGFKVVMDLRMGRLHIEFTYDRAVASTRLWHHAITAFTSERVMGNANQGVQRNPARWLEIVNSPQQW